MDAQISDKPKKVYERQNTSQFRADRNAKLGNEVQPTNNNRHERRASTAKAKKANGKSGKSNGRSPRPSNIARTFDERLAAKEQAIQQLQNRIRKLEAQLKAHAA